MSRKIELRIAAIVVAALIASPAQAVDKLYSPIVEAHELELEYTGNRTFDNAHEKNDLQGHTLEVGYGFTDWWASEIVAGMAKEPDHNFRLDEVEWENIFQLAEQGKYWLDPGLLLTYIHAVEKNDPEAIEAKLLLQKDWGKWTHLANIGIEQEIGAHSSGGPDRSLVWSSRYRYSEQFQPGVELQSGFGKANNHLGFDEQEHYIGPAVYGRLFGNLRYQAAYLFGVSDASSQSAARLLLEYEIHL